MHAGHGGDGRPQTDQDMGAEAGGPALLRPLDADHAAAQQRQRHPEDNAGQAHPPQKIQFVQHIPASYISSMARTSGL